MEAGGGMLAGSVAEAAAEEVPAAASPLAVRGRLLGLRTGPWTGRIG